MFGTVRKHSLHIFPFCIITGICLSIKLLKKRQFVTSGVSEVLVDECVTDDDSDHNFLNSLLWNRIVCWVSYASQVFVMIYSTPAFPSQISFYFFTDKHFQYWGNFHFLFHHYLQNQRRVAFLFSTVLLLFLLTRLLPGYISILARQPGAGSSCSDSSDGTVSLTKQQDPDLLPIKHPAE